MNSEILSDAEGRFGSLVRRLLGLSPRRAADAALFVLVCAWPWVGLFGREPWKSDEAYTFGLIWSLIQGKGWLVPMLAGEPFMEKPPLFYWVAALCAELFGGIVPFHEAARVAIAVFLYLTLGFLAATANALYGRQRGAIAVVLFIGSAGLFDKVHILIADVSLLAGLSIAFFGLATSQRRPIAGGIALGIGTGMAFMSKGLIGLGIPGATAAALAFVPAWRSRPRLQCFAVAAALLVPMMVAWPAALYRASPELFGEWLWMNNLGRFFGFVTRGEGHGLWFYPVTLLWLSFPLWPFAIAAGRAAWVGKEHSRALLLPTVAFLVTMTALMFAAQSRAIYAIPALLQLSLLAVAGLDHAPNWFVGGLQRTSLLLFPAAVAALWLAWLAVVLEIPWGLSVLGQRQPGFSMPSQPAAMTIAAVGTALWWLAVRRRRISAENAVRAWTAGLTAFWVLVFTLWLPYLDYGMRYRSVATALQQALPRDESCIASLALGESQRAMFDYYAGLVTRRLEADPDAKSCRWLLLQETGHPPALPAYAGWSEVWRGTRPGDDRETFHLYRGTD
ncbi:MAG: glycosyltransferase family 39 protein [Pseudomonadota bacterium]|nr:glycosyltransferase family 39 protein [Pseudomonadota bacterium]